MFVHPDKTNEDTKQNPRIRTCAEFIGWVGSGCPLEEDVLKKNTENINGSIFAKGAIFYEEKYQLEGLRLVTKGAQKGLEGYSTILAGYYVYHARDIKKGFAWAKKGAEMGETGCMVILGDAYFEGNGLVADRVEGLKWYFIAKALGDLAAAGRLLAIIHCSKEDLSSIIDSAQIQAQQWQTNHHCLFIDECICHD